MSHAFLRQPDVHHHALCQTGVIHVRPRKPNGDHDMNYVNRQNRPSLLRDNVKETNLDGVRVEKDHEEERKVHKSHEDAHRKNYERLVVGEVEL
eukprot:CAMPEP_0172603508 /NCGR_PEP_ID=MMETSP1068-20121228/23752_1 /TAXON_ID=35684 /ORGANISM="Pseudopedinella elastica, Strain CCMP716" /LENGTH=93 /DNA_ID=CAMNT_0013405271 /DNA_START=262 /DNA_END=543 /DNA_ORIENTATION=-